jgi:signal transduction histidine kinase
MSWTDIFINRIPHIYFVYGLAFFVLGLAVALEVGRAEPSRFRRAMWPLAVFGLVHGTHEWIEMFVIVGREAYGFETFTGFEILRLVLLAVSFAALFAFGLQMLRPFRQFWLAEVWIYLAVLFVYSLELLALGFWLNWDQPGWFQAGDAIARYSLAIPGAVFTTWALLQQRQTFLRLNQPIFANDLLWAALAFLLYGLVGQFFVGVSPLFPSYVVNADTFQVWFGIPIQLFRAAMAAMVAFFTIRALRAFEYNRQQELAQARRRVSEEIARRGALRQELVHRIVETQEDERARIARELHDELGQMLTGLAIGLRGAQATTDKPDLHRQQLAQLEDMAVQALSNMRHLVNELRPALLDDMGLPAALRHHKDSFVTLTGVETELSMGDHPDRLPRDIETVLFRITQEALTNIARHANASHAWIELYCQENIAVLTIRDNGSGFDPQAILNGNRKTGLGLIGIQERVNLTGGTLKIDSKAGSGTTLMVMVPLHSEREV